MPAIAQYSPTHSHALHVVIPASSASAADEHTPAPSTHAQTPLAQSASSLAGLSESRESLHVPTAVHGLQLTRGHGHELLRELDKTQLRGNPHEFFALSFLARAETGSPTRPGPSPHVMRRSSLFTEDVQPEEGGPLMSGVTQMLPATAESAEPLSAGAFVREQGESSQESVPQVEDSDLIF